jgi:hypothetical protein
VFRRVVGLGLDGFFLFLLLRFSFRVRRGLAIGLILGPGVAALPPIFPRGGDGGRPLLGLHGRSPGLISQACRGAVDGWYVIHSHRSMLLLLRLPPRPS